MRTAVSRPERIHDQTVRTETSQNDAASPTFKSPW